MNMYVTLPRTSLMHVDKLRKYVANNKVALLKYVTIRENKYRRNANDAAGFDVLVVIQPTNEWLYEEIVRGIRYFFPTHYFSNYCCIHLWISLVIWLAVHRCCEWLRLGLQFPRTTNTIHINELVIAIWSAWYFIFRSVYGCCILDQGRSPSTQRAIHHPGHEPWTSVKQAFYMVPTPN